MIDLQDFFTDHPTLAREMISSSDIGWVISGTEGQVFWCNSKFSDETGYTLAEFTRATNPITWTFISAKDETLEAAKALAVEASEGRLEKFRLVKTYITKTGQPKMARVYVRRFPPDGHIPFEFFVAEVEFVTDPHIAVAKAYEQLARETHRVNTEVVAVLARVAEAQERCNESSIGSVITRVASWCADHPKVSIPLIALPLILFAGPEVWDRVIKLLGVFGRGTIP